MPIRIVIAEDDSLLRRTLVELLRLEPDLEPVGDAGNGRDALALVPLVRPDVLLTDLEMPLLDGETLIRTVREEHPGVAVVVLTKFGDDERLFGALKAGALGYVLKDADREEIHAAIRRARDGEGALSPALTARVMAEFTRLQRSVLHERRTFAELTRREVEVLECLAQGLKNPQIADRLSLAEKTVKTHVGAILRKLQVNDRREAADRARRAGVGG